MSEPVLATETAVVAARRMGAALSGDIHLRLRQLVQAGQQLSSPSVWDGAMAVSFRRTWPQERARLESTLQSLAGLQRRAQVVIQAIEKAGTDGQLGGRGTQNGVAWEIAFGNATSIAAIPAWIADPIVSRFLAVAEEGEKGAKDTAKAIETIDSLMSREFAGRVRPVMSAMSRGEATFEDLQRVVRGTQEMVAEWQAALKVNTAFLQAYQDMAKGIGWLRGADIGLGALGILGDASTLWHPNGHGYMAWADRGAAAVNLGLTTWDAGLGVAGLFGVEAAIPVWGEVAMAGTGLYMIGSYLYQHWTPFRHLANDVGHVVAGVAKTIWNLF